MRERKETINIVTANVWGLVLLAVAAVAGTAYYIAVSRALGLGGLTRIHFGGEHLWSPLLWLAIYMAVMVAGIVAHELVHGITWAHYAKNGWKSISFGVMWKLLTPYCHCSEPLRVSHYRTGALMPLYVLGLLPLLVSPFVRSMEMCVFGMFFISAAAGDLMIVWRLRKEAPSSTVLDHPTEAGYLVYEQE